MNNDDKSSHRIHIEGMEVLARIGVTDQERASDQRLSFNITFWPTHSNTDLNDDIARTIDYTAVWTETGNFVSARSDRLIETLADALAIHLLEKFAIERITIELRKFILPQVKFVSVSVTRERSPKG